MIAFALYLLKVVLCSGLLYLYYLVGLRNRLFHGWNRFYLLAAVLLSLVIPLIQINVTQTEKLSGEPPIQLLQVVESTNAYLEEITVTPQQPTGTSWIVYIYMAVGVFFLSGLLAAILKIIRLLRSHESHTIGNVRFINTGVRGAPFSFLHF